MFNTVSKTSHNLFKWASSDYLNLSWKCWVRVLKKMTGGGIEAGRTLQYALLWVASSQQGWWVSEYGCSCSVISTVNFQEAFRGQEPYISQGRWKHGWFFFFILYFYFHCYYYLILFLFFIMFTWIPWSHLVGEPSWGGFSGVKGGLENLTELSEPWSHIMATCRYVLEVSSLNELNNLYL